MTALPPYFRGPSWAAGLFFTSVGILMLPLAAKVVSPVPVLIDSGERYPLALFLPALVSCGVELFLVRGGRAGAEALSSRELWRYDLVLTLVPITLATLVWVATTPPDLTWASIRNLLIYTGVGMALRRTGYEAATVIAPVVLTILAASLGQGFAPTEPLVRPASPASLIAAVGLFAAGLAIAIHSSTRTALARSVAHDESQI